MSRINKIFFYWLIGTIVWIFGIMFEKKDLLALAIFIWFITFLWIIIKGTDKHEYTNVGGEE